MSAISVKPALQLTTLQIVNQCTHFLDGLQQAWFLLSQRGQQGQHTSFSVLENRYEGGMWSGVRGRVGYYGRWGVGGRG